MSADASKQWGYRLGLLLRGPGHWHWRYYGKHYQAIREGDGWNVSVDGFSLRANSLLHWQPPGRTLHILLSGPSAGRVVEPARLVAHPAITVNGSHRLLDGTDRKAALYLISDVGFVRRQWSSFVQGVERAEAVALDHRVLMEVTRKDAALLQRQPVYLFDNLTRPYRRSSRWWRLPTTTLPREARRCAFSMDAELGFFPSCTVAYLALQLAASQQPRRIVFFGLDLSDGARFYHEATPEQSMLRKDFDEYILPDLRFASGLLREAKIDVLNASPGTALPASVFPIVEPESCLPPLADQSKR